MSEYFETPQSRLNPEIEHSTSIDALLIMGCGVRPQLRGKSGERHVVNDGMYDDDASQYDARILRSRIMAAKELAVRGLIDGPIIPSGAATINKERLNQDVYEMQYDMAVAENLLRDKGVAPTEEAIKNELLEVYDYLDVQQQHELLGRPENEKEKKLLEETSEAKLMSELLRRVRARPDAENREVVPIEIFEENQAKNTIENVIYTLNKLDKDAESMFTGTLSILTSNNGHLERSGLILQIFGIDPEKTVLLDPEQILRHFGYDERYIRHIEEHNNREDTMRHYTRWMEGLRSLPDYVLPELALIENNDRLKYTVSSLRHWYQQVGVDICTLHPELLGYETMDPNKLRDTIKKISRLMPPEEWKDRWNTVQMRQNISKYKKQTEAWLNGEKISLYN
jgi:hypothetical protein